MLFGKSINRYYLRYLLPLLTGLAALVAVDVIQLKIPELYRVLINSLKDNALTLDILLDEICLPLIFIIVVLVVGRFLWRICFFGSAIKVETDLRRRMFDRCRMLSQQFYQVNKVGDLMSLFTNDLETVQDCFGSGILLLCDALFLGILALYKMWRLDRVLTCFTLIPLFFLIAGGLITGKYIEKKWNARQEAFSKMSDFSQESFAGIAVIKAFVKESAELLQFKKHNKENEDTNVDYTKFSTLLRICVTLFVESITCIILGYGGYLVSTGSFDAGKLVEYLGYFTATVWPAMAVSELVDMTSRGKASLKRISNLLDEEINVKDRDGVTECGPLTGNIKIDHLTFRYPLSEYDALTDISLDIKAGESVGIVGGVGSGKTTLVDLILRTYNVPDGKVFLDGHDVNDIPIKTVRQYTAYVPQDNFLFSDTIENNISFATDGGSFDDVVKAAEYSDVDGDISEFPDKYKTVLGERGVTVSGGQKQRISIARALMKNAAILILDDSVSAVDVKTEKKILESLEKLRAGKTTILIAHRVSTIEKMQKIVFMNEGRIVAVGSHEELYATCPEYHRMVELQRLDDAEAAGSKEEVSANA